MKPPNEKHNAFFTDENYAVMRHAHTKESEAVLWPQSAAICEQVVADFAKTINNRPVAIFHSPLHRAVVTAMFVATELEKHGVKTTKITPCIWLKSDSFKLSNENISTALKNTGGSFALFITHYPDIKRFLGVTRPRVEIPEAHHCTIFARNFLIPGKRD